MASNFDYKSLDYWEGYRRRFKVGRKVSDDPELGFLPKHRVTEAEAQLCDAMVSYASSGFSTPPFGLVEQCLRVGAVNAYSLAASALRTVAEKQPDLWPKIAAYFEQSDHKARRELLGIGYHPTQRYEVLMRGLTDVNSEIRLDSLKICFWHEPRSCYGVAATLLALDADESIQAALAALNEYRSAGYRIVASSKPEHVQVEVPLGSEGEGHGLASEDVPDWAIKALGIEQILEVIKRTHRDSSMPYPIEWRSHANGGSDSP
jgi:hypothetical protein